MAISPYLKRLRQAVGHETLLVPSVSVIIKDASDRVLLQQRADNGEWCLPCGMMDPGERIAEAAIREVREETGLDIKIVRLVGVYSDPSAYTYPNGDSIQPMLALFEGRVVSGVLMPDYEEVVQLGYFKLEALPESLAEQQRMLISDALANRQEAFFR